MAIWKLTSGKAYDDEDSFNTPAFINLVPGQGCEECDNPRGGPQHYGSPVCRSLSLAAGPYDLAHGGEAYKGRAHCSCDFCY